MFIPTLLLQTVAISGGTIHTLELDQKPFVGTILIENSYITAVGENVTIPAGSATFDATGKHVIPGLVDGFVNLDPDHDALYVSAGVTLVRDAGNEHARILAETDRNARDRSPGPWIFCAGAVIDGSPPVTRSVVLIDTAVDAENKLPLMFEDGVDYLAFQKNLTLEPWKKVIALAHGSNRQVWGSLPKGGSFEALLEAGQDGVFHLDAFLPTGTSWDALTPEMIERVAKQAGEKRLAVTPTLAVYAKRLLKPNESDALLSYLSPYYTSTWQQDLVMREKLVTRELLETGAKVVATQGALVEALAAHGCRIVPGSGSPNAWLFPGTSLLDELSLLRRAGFSTPEIVRLATQGAADVIGATKRGTIKVGKVGDLVVTASNPLEDIGHLYKPAAVVLRGRILTRAQLDQRLEAVAATQARVRETLSKPIVVAEPELPTGDVVMTGAVETRGIGARISAEKYAVVRRYDGALTYSGRVVVPGEATVYGTETVVQQTIQNGDLVEFDVKVTSGPTVVAVHGTLVAGKMAIERRLNDRFIGTDNVSDRFAFVDCGSVTGVMVMGYHKAPGEFKVLAFDDLEPAMVLWQMQLDKNALHVVRTPADMRVAYDDVGAIRELKRQVGNGIVQTLPLETKIVDGKGLPMPMSKRDAAPRAIPAGGTKDAPK
ncbi:MAG: amidohydrolase family protein [Planctomycetota bacterium]|nr:amidohydrolase family protein [Planctomycetota bacterium]